MVTLSDLSKTFKPPKRLKDVSLLSNPDNVFYVHAEFKVINGELKCVNHYAGIKGKRTGRNAKPSPVKIEDVSVDEEVFF